MTYGEVTLSECSSSTQAALSDASLPALNAERTNNYRVPIDDAQAAAAYRLLLREPHLDLEQFAERMECSAERVRAILDRLADLALVRHQRSEYGSITAVSPIVAMQQLMAREQALLEQRQRFLQQSLETFSSIIGSYVIGREEIWIGELVTDLPSVRRRLEELASQARDEVLSLSPSALNPTATRAASRPLDLAGLSRGIRMRTIYQEQVAVDEGALSYAQELTAAGAEIRLVPVIPIRCIVVDRELAIVPRVPGNDTEGALIVRHGGIILALVELFECYWHQGMPLPGQDTADGDCTPAERSVLRLLTTGAKDDAVARHLGMSVRTVRRIIADLTERAKVSSRFALAVHAVKHDWI